MSTLSTILAADFLLRDALVASVLVGLVCPLVGVYFILRRMIFLGVALPQVSAAGVAFSFLVDRWLAGPHEQVQVGERMLGLIGSGVFTMTTTLVLAMLERNGRERIEVRIGVTYAMAAATTILPRRRSLRRSAPRQHLEGTSWRPPAAACSLRRPSSGVVVLYLLLPSRIPARVVRPRHGLRARLSHPPLGPLFIS
jgi:hypothetical protein